MSATVQGSRRPSMLAASEKLFTALWRGHSRRFCALDLARDASEAATCAACLAVGGGSADAADSVEKRAGRILTIG
jgi:hypothetical protein